MDYSSSSAPTTFTKTKPLRVLHLSTYGRQSGAGLAAWRIVEAQRAIGIQADLRVVSWQRGKKDPPSPYIHSVLEERAGYLRWQLLLWAERGFIAAINGLRRETLFKISLAHWGVLYSSHCSFSDYDLIHIHWTQHAGLSLSTLEQIQSFGLPVVITLHDYWFATALCQIPHLSCQQWSSGCTACPMLLPSTRCIARKLFALKRRIMAGNIHWVTVSSSLAETLSSSLIQPGCGCCVIGNPLDEEHLLTSLSPRVSRIPQSPLTLLFVAARIDDPVKGWDYLEQAMVHLAELLPDIRKQIQLIFVGRIRNPNLFERLPISVDYRGVLSSPSALAECYRKADLLLSTSHYESFGQTLSEALAYGTPLLVRDSGGPRDIVLEGVNGALTSYDDPSDMARRLYDYWLKGVPYLSEDCIRSALRFHPNSIAKRYLECYQKLLVRS